MCSLCGVLGGKGHWTDSSTTPKAFRSRAHATTRPGERQERTRLANAVLKHYGLTLSDWTGACYVLSTRTGRKLLVDNLAEVWAAAESLGKTDCDPLDDSLLTALARPVRS